ncbi:MAG: PQQ-binding-like beta-propeller repeat protein [bacterium]|nr:PQQ-binding-like beta-propeller repeat protein [bacterium]
MKKLTTTIALFTILLLSFLIPQKISGQLADSPWPMFLHDNRHTGQSSNTVPDSVTLIWKFETDKEVTSPPTIGSDGTIYFCAEGEPNTNIVYALYPSGALKWKYHLNNFIYGRKSTPAIGSNGYIYVAATGTPTSGDCLFALDQDGKVKWKTKIGKYADGIDSSPAIGTDGTIYIGSNSDTLYAINPNGTIKWRFGTGRDVQSSPSIGSDGTIYINSNDGYLYAVRPNGTLKWKYKIGGSVYIGESSPSIGKDGTIYVGSDDGNLYAINPDGSLKWKNDVTWGWIKSSPVIGNDGTIYLQDGYQFFAISADGNKKWHRELANANTTSADQSPAIDSQGIIYTSYPPDYSRSNFFAIMPDNSLKWNYELLDLITTSPCIGSDGSIYFGTENGLCCLGKPGGGETPDLIVSGIKLNPAMFGTPGVEYQIIAEVNDLTGLASAYCTVSFYYDNFENFIDSTSIYVPSAMPGYAQVSWITQNYQSRDYVIIAKISDSKPSEANTDNNVNQINHTLLPFIQNRIDLANWGDTVWVDPGIYLEHVSLKSGVTVRSKEGNLVTIIDGNGATPAVTASSISNATLDGFTIRNGNPSGVEIDLAQANIINNIITENRESFGQGIKLRGLEVSLIMHNVIINNNQGINANNSNAQILNNIIFNNDEGVHSVGFYVPSPLIMNCIIWNNNDDLTYSASATYSDISDSDQGTGNISLDPQLVNSDIMDFRLQPTSPCIDKGNPGSRYNDVEDKNNPGYALYPALGTICNDMGICGGNFSNFITNVNDQNIDISVLKKDYHLYHNYPNPFNPVTTIKYQLPKESYVVLKIFNQAGQLVRELLNKNQSPGIYEIQWNGKNDNGQSVVSGVYLYNLKTDNFEQTRKMVLLR